AGDVVEYARGATLAAVTLRRVAIGIRFDFSERVERGVRVALALPGFLVDERHDAGKGRRREGSTARALKIVQRTGRAVDEFRQVATRIPGDVLVRLAHDIEAVVQTIARKQGNIRQVAMVVGRHAGNARLPRRLGVDGAWPTAASYDDGAAAAA